MCPRTSGGVIWHLPGDSFCATAFWPRWLRPLVNKYLLPAQDIRRKDWMESILFKVRPPNQSRPEHGSNTPPYSTDSVATPSTERSAPTLKFFQRTIPRRSGSRCFPWTTCRRLHRRTPQALRFRKKDTPPHPPAAALFWSLADRPTCHRDHTFFNMTRWETLPCSPFLTGRRFIPRP